MAHSQAEKPARVCDQWDGTLTDRNNQGGRGDKTTRLAGMMSTVLNQTVRPLGKRQQQQQQQQHHQRIRLRGCHLAVG